MSLRDLPTLNAALNALSALCLLCGWLLVRSGRKEAHRRAMLAAVSCSALFLASYVYYHANVGSVRFGGQGLVRGVYFAVLISHTVLATAILPLVALTLSHAVGRRFDRHRRIARLTLPLWAYVSVTGVVVYAMLYHL